MPAALTDTNISTTYVGVLHAEGAPIPASGLKGVYDGVGNKSSLSIGRDGNGIKVTGTITADAISITGGGGDGLDVSTKAEIVDLIYPVGAIYIAMSNDINPETLFGGSWTRIAQGRFLVGVGGNSGSQEDGNGDRYKFNAGQDNTHDITPPNAPQGEYNHTTSISEMPTHGHPVEYNTETNEDSDSSGTIVLNNRNGNKQAANPGNPSYVNFNNNNTNCVGGEGGGQPHNNIPPWFGAYMWKRES